MKIEKSDPIFVFEVSSKENFFSRGYVLANQDIRAARVVPEQHFLHHGIHENRKQFTRFFLEDDSYWREKYRTFAHVLNLPNEAHLLCKNAGKRFPIRTSDTVHDLSEYAGESANHGFIPFLEEIALNPDKLYLDLGCGLRDRVYRNCLYLEVYPSLTADVIVAPDQPYPLADNSFDGIGCFAVLEHTRRPWEVVREIHRILKPGGVVFIDWPFLQPVHGFPSHYFNATREGLESIFKDTGFQIKKVSTLSNQTPDWAVSWILSGLIGRLRQDKKERILNMTIGDFIRNPPQNDFWIDLIADMDDRTVAEFASGNTLIAHKSADG